MQVTYVFAFKLKTFKSSESFKDSPSDLFAYISLYLFSNEKHEILRLGFLRVVFSEGVNLTPSIFREELV